MVKVESGVPLPRSYPFAQMKVGDSFLIPEGVSRNTVSVAALRYGREHGARFTVRKTDTGVYRCWRIE